MARKTAEPAAHPDHADHPDHAERLDHAPGTPRRDFPLADHTGVLLHKAGLLIQEEVDQALAAAGFKLRNFLVLAALAGGAELSQQDLAQVINLDPTTMVALIDDLERTGHVERRRNPADRRRYILRLTEDGRQALAELQVVADEAERLFFSRLPDDDREVLHGILGTLLAHRWPTAVCT